MQSGVELFVGKCVVGRLVPTLGAFFVLRAILDTASGEHPLPSMIAAMFLLGTQTAFNVIQSYNTQTKFATADVLDSLWNHLAGTIMPIAAVMGPVGTILDFATRKPFPRFVSGALAMLWVSGIWNGAGALVGEEDGRN